MTNTKLMANKPKYEAISVNISPDQENPVFEWFAINVATNQLCPYLVLEEKIFRSLSGYHLISNDLQFAREALTTLKTSVNLSETVKRSLWFASHVSYAKCFTETKGRGTQLDKDILRGAEESLINTHDRIMRERHEYIAHAGNAGYENSKTMLALNPDVHVKEFYGLYHTLGYVLSLPDEYINESLKLIDHVQAYIEQKLDKLFPAALSHIKGIAIDDLYSQALFPIKNIEECSVACTLSAPPEGMLKSITIKLEIEPDYGGALIYTKDNIEKPLRFDGGITEAKIITNQPDIHFQLINGAHSIKISTLGFNILR